MASRILLVKKAAKCLIPNEEVTRLAIFVGYTQHHHGNHQELKDIITRANLSSLIGLLNLHNNSKLSSYMQGKVSKLMH